MYFEGMRELRSRSTSFAKVVALVFAPPRFIHLKYVRKLSIILDLACVHSPLISGGRSRRGSSRAVFKPSPKKGELGSAEKPVALDSEDEEAEKVLPARKTGKAAEGTPFVTTCFDII